MNEEVNYCDQCGAKIRSESKFCSSCGCALDGSISPKFDATIKVVTTNATVEKGFKTVENGVKATGKGLLFYLTSLKKIIKIIKPIVIVLIFWAAIFSLIVYIGFELRDEIQKMI